MSERLLPDDKMSEQTLGDVVPQETADGSQEIMMPKIIHRLVVMYPSGNTTAVVFDNLLDVPREKFNDRIMEEWHSQNPDKPEIEQCCFITEPKDPRAIARVQMFGGEFCGNATRSVLQLLVRDKDQQGLIEVSGASSLLEFSVNDKNVTVAMPLPDNRESLVKDVEEGVLVRLDGITHLVVTDHKLRLETTERQLLEELLEEDKYNIRQLPAFGVTYYDPATTEAKFAVWVNEVNTIFDETACGSGTCSIGVAMASSAHSSVTLEVLQPSGQTISTESDFDGNNIKASRITGTVDVIYDGAFAID